MEKNNEHIKHTQTHRRKETDTNPASTTAQKQTYQAHLATNRVSTGATNWHKDLVKVLDVIKTAVSAGELDTQIATASVNLRKGFGK